MVEYYTPKGCSKMKLVGKTLTKGGFYTFLITLALLVISHAIGLDDYGNYHIVLNIKLFLACTLCGYIIAVTDLVFETKLDPIIKRAIHFTVLLAGFIFVFATSESGSGLAGRKVLVAIVIYVVVYALLFLLFFLGKKLYAYIVKSIEGEPSKKGQQNNGQYKPRYKK